MARLKNYHSKGLLEAGVDEVGRGCLAGPVVAAAAILPPRFRHPLLNDSKQVKQAQRERLDAIIREKAIAFHVAEVDHETIDQINILQATYKAMHIAIAALDPSPEHILVDGNRFLPYPFIPHTCVVKGDSKYKNIAAASILAKVYRDKLMRAMAETHPGYGWERNVGYPTAEHRQAIADQGLSPIHRRSFKLKNSPS